MNKITLPWPPTINTYYRHVGPKVLISKKGRQYRKTVAQYVMENRFHKFEEKRLKVDIIAYPPDKRRRDLDNLLKAPQDSLQHAGVFHDDSQIADLRIRRGTDGFTRDEIIVSLSDMADRALEPDHKYDLETAVQMVLNAGLSTGHADTCADLMMEVLGQIGTIKKS